jgi:hypothetical protein
MSSYFELRHCYSKFALCIENMYIVPKLKVDFKVSSSCEIFPITFVIYGEVIKVEYQLDILIDSFK